MNPGPVEEGAKVANTFVDAMRTNPLALSLAVSNILILGLFFYIAWWAGTNRQSEFKALQDNQKEVMKMLYNCTPNPQRSGEFRLQSDESIPYPLPRPPEAQ